MSIQFVDMRISQQANSDASPTAIPVAATPLVFGDIGLQTAGVSVANQGLVRVQLNGFAKIVVGPQFGTVTIHVYRNAVLIFETVYGAADSLDNQAFGFSTVDFPPAAVVATGQIQYTAEIFTAAANPGTTIGARNFSGTAVAGNFTG
ncbi:hypothetical protein K0T92_20470 [Paenibacillus oenotherae]|uniref:Uncharacterized protein n=1 Tax=Paenibacillus oenotherae TaxID=1435645 RepID=A0ABS7DAX9_9BACL|nr:hypothetical protein [Paenibacillus oenotherae]MBW7477097.1 hypothetical protein [Paenibacillus oenotherae]